MRRKDKEIQNFDEIISILSRCEVIRLGLNQHGVPYIVPLNFAYEAVADAGQQKLILYFHSAREGRKIEILKENPYVCFEADCGGKTARHDHACNWSYEFESVIGYGTVTFLNDNSERIAAMNQLMIRYGFEGKPEYRPEVFARTLLYKLTVEQITAKRSQKS